MPPHGRVTTEAGFVGTLRAGIIQGLAAAFGLLLLQAQARAEELAGRVVGVSDGDTLTVLTEGQRQVRVRLAEIDTPEAAQPYGARARQELSELVFGRPVEVAVQDTDRYGRAVGRVRADGRDVNAEMVRRGAVWVYRQYNRDPALPRLEAEARATRRGLWALPEAERVPPWEWRAAGAAAREQDREQGRRTAPSAARPPPAATFRGETGGFACGTKRTCGEMASCAEARFHVEQCGLARLDGDRDGVPCERLCR